MLYRVSICGGFLAFKTPSLTLFDSSGFQFLFQIQYAGVKDIFSHVFLLFCTSFFPISSQCF